jgi:hypothetical protein
MAWRWWKVAPDPDGAGQLLLVVEWSALERDKD